MSATKAPHLAMLWESSDPQAALLRRFGFTGVGEAAEWLAATLARGWGIEMTSCERVMISAGNALAWITADARPLLAKWSVVSRLYPRLAELARLTTWLDARGLPVAGPMPSRDGSPQVEVDGVSLGVQPVVDGAHLDVAEPDQVRAAGVALATLHLALADYPDVDRLTALAGQGDPEPLTIRITRWLESSGHHLPSDAIEWLRTSVTALRPDDGVPAQLIHHDFRSANVICAGPRVLAVLDFEEVAFDHPVVDLAKASVLLGTEFRNWGPVSSETHDIFVAGYQSIRPLSPTEDAWLRPLILWRTLQAVPAGDDPAGWATSVRRQVAAASTSR